MAPICTRQQQLSVVNLTLSLSWQLMWQVTHPELIGFLNNQSQQFESAVRIF